MGHDRGHAGYAEYTAVPADNVTVLPDGVDLDITAAVALAGSTAHVLVRLATSVTDKVVVVHAAAGMTGGAVVQLARAEGARVIAVASTRAKADVAAWLGAQVIAADEQPDLAGAVLGLTGGRGVDLVFDATGRATFEASLRMLGTRGTLVLYGAATGHPDPFAVGALSGLTGATGLNGSLSISWVAAGDYLTGPGRSTALRAVLDDVAAARLNPRIEGRLPLREAALAHSRLGGRTVTRKLLLQP